MNHRASPTKTGALRHNVLSLAVLGGLALLPLFVSNQYFIHVAALVAIYIVLALGVNVSYGFAGMLNLGYAALFGIGAYCYAVLNVRFGIPFWLGLPISASATAFFGILIGWPTLRVRGDYLAVVTLAFGEVTRLIFRNWDALTGGPKGIPNIAPPRLGSFEITSPAGFYYLALTFALLAYHVAQRWRDSKLGRSWRATKDNELAASTVGIDPSASLMTALVVSSVFAGTAGAIFAAWQSFVSPQSFTLLESITILAMAILGGGSPRAVVATAGILVLLPEFLRPLAQYRMLLFGFALVLITLVRPRWRRARRHLAPVSGMDDRAVPQAPPPATTEWTGSGVLLEVVGLSKSFDGVSALSDIGLTIQSDRPSITAVIGPNGAGKTTLFNCISGVTGPTSGTILFGAQQLDITRLPPHKRSALGIARNFQDTRLFSEMTVLENVLVGLDCHSTETVFSSVVRSAGFRVRRRIHVRSANELLRFVGLEGEAGRLASQLSFGQQRRLELARTLALAPRLILLDEPTTGMNETQRRIVVDLIRRTCTEKRVSVLLIEHDMDVAMSLADRVVVLDAGRKIAEGTPDEVRNNGRVVEAYLGKSLTAHGTLPPLRPHGRDALLCLREVRAGYADRLVLDGVSISVGAGEIVALFGPNGAGKTTALMAVSQLVRVTKGTVTFRGQELTCLSPSQVVRLGVVHVPQGRGVFPRLTVLENLRMGAYLQTEENSFRENLRVAFGMFPILWERRNLPSGHLSGGEQQMLAIARALMTSPSLLMLDEPSLGLAPGFAADLFSTLRDLRNRGVAILLVEQKVRDALALADRAYILEGGRIRLSGTADELSDDEEVKRAYLGGGNRDVVPRHIG